MYVCVSTIRIRKPVCTSIRLKRLSEQAQPVRSKYSVLYSKQAIHFRHMVSVRRLHGSEGKAKGHKGRQLSSSSKVDYVNLLLDFTRQFQLYGVTASTFKTCESDRIRFRTVLFMVYMVRLHEVPTVLFMVYTVRPHKVPTVLFMV